MTRELTHQLERLGQERHRLEALLARVPAWRSLMQLSTAAQPADDFGRYVRDRRRSELERELALDPLYAAHRSVVSAMEVIEGLIASQDADLAPFIRDDDKLAAARSASHRHALATTAGKPGSSTGAAPARDVELLSLAGAAGGRLVTRNATIHTDQPASPGQLEMSLDAPPDPLTRIRRIDKGLAAALIARGVRHFAQIAAFGPADVRALSAALGLGRRISQENWIEQAALLAMKSGAASSADMPPATPSPTRPHTPLAHAEQREPVAPPDVIGRGHAGAGPTTPETDLHHAASERTQRSVAAAAAAIASAVANRHVGPAVTGTRNISAAEPASPDDAHGALDDAHVPDDAHAPDIAAFDALLRAAELDASAFYVAEMVRDAAMRIAASVRRPLPQSENSEPALRPPAPSCADPALGIADAPILCEPLPPRERDDLTLIDGVDADTAAGLAALRITRFEQISAWDAPAVTRISERLGLGRQVARRGWIEQAALLATGRLTAHAARIARGEPSSVVERPATAAERDEAFSAWLCAHSLSHGSAAAEPEPDGPVISETPDAILHPAVAGEELPEPGAVPPEPILAEFEDVVDICDLAAGASTPMEPAEAPSHPGLETPTGDVDGPGHAPPPEAEPATAEIIPLRHVISIDAEDPVGPDPDAAAGSDDTAHIADEAPRPEGPVAAGVADDEAAAEAPATREEAAQEAPGDAIDAIAESGSPRHEPQRPLTIVDRITAIERGVDDLSAPPRLVLARFRERALDRVFPLPDMEQTPADPGAGPVSSNPPENPPDHDTPQSDASEDVASAAEADVRIIMREAHAAGLAPAPAEPPANQDQNRALDIDQRAYAAYHDVVEEASVEIVKSALPGEGMAPEAPGPKAGETTGLPNSAGTGETGKVRRFLKALTGN